MPWTQEIKDRIQDLLGMLPNDLLFVNPDCGLKTRAWKETEEYIMGTIPLTLLSRAEALLEDR